MGLNGHFSEIFVRSGSVELVQGCLSVKIKLSIHIIIQNYVLVEISYGLDTRINCSVNVVYIEMHTEMLYVMT